MKTKAEFAIDILKQYATESGNMVRGTTDLSPMEEWLIIKLWRFFYPEDMRTKEKERDRIIEILDKYFGAKESDSFESIADELIREGER